MDPLGTLRAFAHYCSNVGLGSLSVDYVFVLNVKVVLSRFVITVVLHLNDAN